MSAACGMRATTSQGQAIASGDNGEWITPTRLHAAGHDQE